MKREELLAQCRYYKGEDDFEATHLPGKYFLFWEAEWAACEYVGTKHARSSIGGYKNCGSPGIASNIALPILAELFVLYCKGADEAPGEMAKSFEKICLARYMASTSMMV